MKYSNPRLAHEATDWPFGRHTCRAKFVVETHPKRGQRVLRYTENKTRTGWNKPKTTTYAPMTRIVDGDDDRTYIISASRYGDMVCVMPGTMKTSDAVHESSDPEQYAALMALFTA